MKILIVGSRPKSNGRTGLTEGKEDEIPPSSTEERAFEKACYEIGAAFALNGQTLVVGSAASHTADRHVLEGANSVLGIHSVIVIRPDDGRLGPDSKEFTNLTFSRRRIGQNWTVARAFQIKEADVVVVIGGDQSTLQAGHMAPALEKPTLVIRAFPGTARELWDAFKSDYQRADISGQDIGVLEDTCWTGETAKVVARAAVRLVKRNPYQVNRVPILMSLLLGVLLIMATWIAIFVNPGMLPKSSESVGYATFILLGLAAFLGSGLRTVLPMLEGRTVSLLQLLSEMIVGIFLAFGFMLIYLASGILIKGNVAVDEASFRNAAVTTSLMGLAVAFFAERAANKLREQLGEHL